MLKGKKVHTAAVCMWLTAGTALAFSRPVTIAEQGSFMAGGTVITAPGTYDGTKPADHAGETLHGDHAYVFYQKPVHAHRYAMVFLHGYGQSAKTWETTADGRDGFQNIFLEKGYATYLVDQPRRGRAGRATVPGEIGAQPDDQAWFNMFRFGQWPNYYDNAAFPRDAASMDQFFHAMTPDTGKFDEGIVADAMAAVFAASGDGVLVTHSAGGGPGWATAMKSDKVRGVIALEPGTFPFPEGEVPAAEPTTSPFPAVGKAVPLQEFMKLTKIPIVVYFGDNIPTAPTENWGADNWRVRVNLARKWAAAVNAHGGDAAVVMLPELGIKGSTHFMMSDLNNTEVADAMEAWMREKGLAQ